MWTIELDVTAEHDGTNDFLKDVLLATYADLRTNGSVVSAQMWAAVARNEISFKIVTSDDDRLEATRCASAAVRAAFCAAGASTPGWVEQTELLIDALERAEITSRPLAAV